MYFNLKNIFFKSPTNFKANSLTDVTKQPIKVEMLRIRMPILFYTNYRLCYRERK